jgi:hypothetical protein
MADVNVPGMEVHSSWTGATIAEFIQRHLDERPGLRLAYAVCDQGTNILAALRQLTIPVVSDCSHVMMNLVKKLFRTDVALSELGAGVGKLRQQLSLTDHTFLLPPTLRDKDRFLRIFTIVKWADRMDSYWDKLPRDGRAKIAFYRRAGTVLGRLRQVRRLVVIASDILKTASLCDDSRLLWHQRSRTYQAEQGVMSRKAAAFIKSMDAYFEQHAELFAQYGRLLCCSEIVESTFGRYKNKGGMKAISADVLAISLYNQPITTAFIQRSMKTASCQ